MRNHRDSLRSPISLIKPDGSRQPRANGWQLAAGPLLLLVLMTLACGSFSPRPTPVPTLPVVEVTPIIEVETPIQIATPTPNLPTSVPTRVVPTPTFTPTPPPGTALMAGQPARVVASQGLNVRNVASVRGERLGRFMPNAVVGVLDGPVEADGYTWWLIESAELKGWVADGDEDELWLSPQLGEKLPVNRPVRLGDEVVVTLPDAGTLKVRSQPGLSSLEVLRLPPGTRLAIVEGPVDVNNYRWWRISSEEDGTLGWAAESDGADRWLSPLE